MNAVQVRLGPLSDDAVVLDIHDRNGVPFDAPTGRGYTQELAGMRCLDVLANRDCVGSFDDLLVAELHITPWLDNVLHVVLAGDVVPGRRAGETEADLGVSVVDDVVEVIEVARLAASLPVAVLLQRTFAQVATRSGRALAVHDLVPLPSSDSSGATSFSVVLSLILAGLVGGSLVFAFTMQRPEAVRVGVTVALAVGAGLVTALVTNVLIGAYPGHFFAVWGVATLFVFAIGLPIAAFQAIFGIAGTAIGWVLFLVIGNPASGGSSAPELLPGFWRTLSQLLPPGAGVTYLRDVVYFDGHASTHALIVLAVYAVVGGTVAMRTRGPAATPAD